MTNVINNCNTYVHKTVPAEKEPYVTCRMYSNFEVSRLGVSSCAYCNAVTCYKHDQGLDKKQIYIIGSLRNTVIQEVSAFVRSLGYNVFDDWNAVGPEADDFWKTYEQNRGRTYLEALEGKSATQVFNFDKSNLDASDAAILVMPAGKSAHLELGYMVGKGKPTIILLDDEADRWDVMYKFASAVCYRSQLQETLSKHV